MAYELDRAMVPPIKVFETDVAAVTAGAPGRGGWVSGSPANLAASGSVICVFDLGQDWHQYPNIQVSVSSTAPSSGLSGVQLYGSDNVTLNSARRLKESLVSGFSTIFASLTTANGAQQCFIKPMGRYLHVSLTNADATNAQGATAKVTVAAYPD